MKKKPKEHKTTVTGIEAREAWQGFLHAYKRVKERLDKALRETVPVSLTEYDVLWLVHEVGNGRLRYIELAKHVHLSQSRVSRQIATLEEKGLLVRDATDSDRRATFAVMTEAGRKVLQDSSPKLWQAWHEHFLHHIHPDDMETFTRIMKDLIAAKGPWTYDVEDNPFLPVDQHQTTDEK